MKRTAIYDIHLASGAKIVDFSGWQMPLSYSDIREEHLAVRKYAGLFDVSHMGEILIKGNDALSFCQFLCTNDLIRINDNQAQYSLMCNNRGGVVDDLLIYRINSSEFLFCVNAANTDKDFNWILENKSGFDVSIDNVSSLYSQLALQGPRSIELLSKVIGRGVGSIKKFHFEKIEHNGSEILVSRTGYTGEDGFEIYVPWNKGPELWNSIVEEGENTDFLPCGLGSRDTLRLEMGYSLYGCEIDENINPLEVGLQKYVKLDKGEFVGQEDLKQYMKSGLQRTSIAFEMVEKVVPRKGYKIYAEDSVVGYVTSGTFSPSLNRSIGLGIVDSEKMNGSRVSLEIRGKKRSAKTVKLPFFHKK